MAFLLFNSKKKESDQSLDSLNLKDREKSCNVFSNWKDYEMKIKRFENWIRLKMIAICDKFVKHSASAIKMEIMK